MIRIAREGLREIASSTLIFGGASALAGWAAAAISSWFLVPVVPMIAVWAFTILFFRDPDRAIPADEGILVSPADGRVADVTRLGSYPGLEGAALRVGIFLSVFDVHVNRAPCAARVSRTTYQSGEFLDARHPECGTRNESNTIVFEPLEGPASPIIVRQIAGLIARRIICRIRNGSEVARGDRIGLIKFGSRTEVIVEVADGWTPAVRVGDRVRGGSSVVMKYVPAPASNGSRAKGGGRAVAPVATEEMK